MQMTQRNREVGVLGAFDMLWQAVASGTLCVESVGRYALVGCSECYDLLCQAVVRGTHALSQWVDMRHGVSGTL